MKDRNGIVLGEIVCENADIGYNYKNAYRYLDFLKKNKNKNLQMGVEMGRWGRKRN